MTVTADLFRPRKRNWPRLASAVGLALALGLLLYMAARIGMGLIEGRFASIGAAPLLVGAIAIYFAGHGFRILRLTLLVGGSGVGFRLVAAFHLLTAGASLAAPLKLGDLYRVAEMSRWAGGFMRALAIAWWERVFDAVVIMSILALVFQAGARGAGFSLVAALAFVFVAVTLTVFFVAPDNLRRLSVLIIRRYDSVHSIPLLQFLEAARLAILEAPKLINGKLPSLAALTALIWGCEIAAFALSMREAAGGLEATLGALVRFLSTVIEGQTLLVALGEGVQSPLFVYLAVTQAPLAVMGLLSGFYYAAVRWRR